MSTIDPVGILAVGRAAPALRLAAADVGAAWGSGGGRGQVAVCDADEDTLTLAWQAATGALGAAGLEPAAVGGLWWGTTRPPLAEGPSHAFLSTALGLAPTVEGALCAGSTHAGMEALLGAWDAVAAGHVDVAVVVASDALVPGPGTAGESTTGAGAAALVLRAAGTGNGSEPPARLVGRAGRTLAVVDRYRGDAAAATADVYDGRLFRDEVFLPLLGSLAAAHPAERWAASDPDGRLAAAALKRAGGELAGATGRQLGDTGAAAPLLGLVEALGAGPGGVGVVGYGGGRATLVSVQVTGSVPGADVPFGASRSASYAEVLRSRGQLVAMTDPIPMGVPPASAAFVRGNVEMLGLQGARCRSCQVVSTPPSIHPRCVGCGGEDLEVVRLARHGTVQTFVVNQTMPPPFQAPLPMVVIDLDDGARLMVQGVPDDAGDLEVGDQVELRLRRYALERGIPVYGYKALRTAGAGAAAAAGKEAR